MQYIFICFLIFIFRGNHIYSLISPKLIKRRSMLLASNGFGSKGFGSKESSDRSTVRKKKNRLQNIEENDKTATRKFVKPIRNNVASTYDQHCPTLNQDFPGLRLVHADPPVYEIDNFLSPEACDQYIDLALNDGYRVQSKTFSVHTAQARTSTTWYVDWAQTAEFLDKGNQLTGFDFTNFEEPQIVRYETGEKFSWHMDTIPPQYCDNGGQRIATMIVYLNDVGLGGETCFQDLKIQVRPKKGKALLFFPAFLDGTEDDRTMHAGQVAFDTKWIAQTWIHGSSYKMSVPPESSHEKGIKAVEEKRKQQS